MGLFYQQTLDKAEVLKSISNKLTIKLS